MESIKRILTQLPRTIWKYKFNILTIIYYCIIACYPSNSVRFVLLIGAGSLFFFHNIIAKTRFSTLWAVLFAMLIAFNAYLSFVFSSNLRVGLLASIMETSITEAGSVLTGVIWKALLIFSVSLALILLSAKELKGLKLSRRKSLFIIVLYCYGLAPLVFRRILITDYRDSYNETPLFTLQIATNHYSPLVYGNVMTVLAYANEMYTFWLYRNNERIIPKGVTLDEEKEKVKTIFLVIGESATPSSMSLYGYNTPTTTFSDSLHRADSTKLFFYNGTSTASYTRNAASAIVSTANAKNQTLFYQEKTLLDLANDAGYESTWISNQARMAFWDTRSNYVGHISASSKNNYFTEDAQIVDDFEMLRLVEQYYKRDEEKLQFVVIHLMGSHYHYEGKHDSIDLAAIPGDGKSLHHLYDLSIHHTDRFMQQLYDRYVKDNSSAMIYYVSDHGEDVGIDLGHGLIPISKVQFEVPLMIYNNSGFSTDSTVKRYMQDDLVSNASTFFILSEAMGYTVSEDIIPQIVEDRKYAIHGDDKMYKVSEIELFKLDETDQSLKMFR